MIRLSYRSPKTEVCESKIHGRELFAIADIAKDEIAPITDEERELAMLYSNHSYDANLGIRGEITFVAMRDIHAGEELTHDWAMTDDDDYSVECRRSAADCRKIVTGKDWQRLELQERYEGYFSAHLARKVAMLDTGVKR